MKKGFWIGIVACLAIAIALSVGLGVGLTRDHGGNSNAIDDNNATLTKVAHDYFFPSLGAAYDNGTFHEAVVGVRKIDTNVKVTNNDIWHFGSNTKAMTATTVGLLIQDGLLQWTSTLGDLLGGVGIEIREEYSDATVQQLSSHTSGIADAALQADKQTIVASYKLSPADGRVLVSNLTLSTASSSTKGTYEYSNMNYVLLGLIIDTVTGQTAEDVIRTRIWTSLGLTTAGFGPSPESSLTSIDNPWPHIANGAEGHGGQPSPIPDNTPLIMRDNPPCYYTAGGAHMTLFDYHKWLRLHFDPAAQSKVNISQPILNKLHEIAPGTGQNVYTYGGWSRLDSPSGDGYSLLHDGSNTLNYATALISVDERRTAVAVTNVGGEAASGTTWTDGTHLVRDDLISGKIVL